MVGLLKTRRCGEEVVWKGCTGLVGTVKGGKGPRQVRRSEGEPNETPGRTNTVFVLLESEPSLAGCEKL